MLVPHISFRIREFDYHVSVFVFHLEDSHSSPPHAVHIKMLAAMLRHANTIPVFVSKHAPIAISKRSEKCRIHHFLSFTL